MTDLYVKMTEEDWIEVKRRTDTYSMIPHRAVAEVDVPDECWKCPMGDNCILEKGERLSIDEKYPDCPSKNGKVVLMEAMG